MPRPRTLFTTIRTEGALLPADLLQRISEGDKEIGGLTPEAYHLSGEKLNEAINRSWNRLLGSWAAFAAAREKLLAGDAGTSVTRERWLLPLFQELGYGRLIAAKAIEIDGKSYSISHAWGDVPLHLIGCGVQLDKRTAGVVGAAKGSPHSLMQEVLNRSPERLWGFVSNGLRMQVLRDNASLTRQAFVEFDLEAMMVGEVYADFVVLWLVCHQSRVEAGAGCWLETWSKVAQERGTRALDGLRDGVEKAIQALGAGFLSHPTNKVLRDQLRNGNLSTQDYYRQLLRLVYRLIFLFVAEDRNLLFTPEVDVSARERYARFYSTARLRTMAGRLRGSRHADLYQGLGLVMAKLGNGGTPALSLPALGGFLFSRSAMSALGDCEVSNVYLLEAVRSLAFSQEGRTRRAVDYKNLGSEELGSVYESLLELHPLINTDAATFALAVVSGSERKTTGSYFTAGSLIKVSLDSALDPIIEQAVRAFSNPAQQIQALLNLKICDPACGSGHFLVAAARRIARRLAQIRSGDEEPSPEMMRAALREVIANCIYGVDINPMSVELCKVSLWMEALEPGKPLSFLDAHIQCGDSLVGVSPNLDISEIPDEAFNPAFGDDKAAASALKKRNKRERTTGQLGMRFDVTHLLTNMDDLVRWLAERATQVDAMPEDDSTQVQAKAKAFDDYHTTPEYLKERIELDLWTAAFFWSIPKADAESMLVPTQQELVQLRNGGEVDARLVERVKELSERLNFFHWKLAFPKVFSGDNSGFDCVLGNPPWEKINLKDEEFFARSHPEIANATTKAIRKKMIDELKDTYPVDYRKFIDEQAHHDNLSNFFRASGAYPLTGVSRINLYSVFAETDLKLLSPDGRLGLVIASGIATDDNNKLLFEELIVTKRLISVFDFENREGLFPAIDSRYKFCLVCVGGINIQRQESDFVFYLTNVEQIENPERHFTLSHGDLLKINPNTRTCPTFRCRQDSEIVKEIYQRIPAWALHDSENNECGVPQTPFNMSNDSALFQTKKQLLALSGNKNTDGTINVNRQIYLPLYESKYIHQFNHRYAAFDGIPTEVSLDGNAVELSIDELQNPYHFVESRYWLNKSIQEERFPGKWFLAYRMIARGTDERSSIAAVIPQRPCGHTISIIIGLSANTAALICANMNSLVFDFVTRLKLPGISFSHWILKQLPLLPSILYTSTDIEFIAPRVLELVYTAYDLRPFAEDMGYHGEPFKWDEERRAQLRAELDAYYARLYGLTRDELRYILDPKEVHGEDFPGETFRVLKDKEIRLYGEYRTRRLVLEAWDEMEEKIQQ